MLENSQTQTLELFFHSSAGKSKKITVAEPRANLDRETTENAMDVLVNSDIFLDEHQQDPYAQSISARYVTREIADIFDVQFD